MADLLGAGTGDDSARPINQTASGLVVSDRAGRIGLA